MSRRRTYLALATPVAVALIVWSCDRAAPVSPLPDRPNFGSKGGEGEECPTAKFTGGGRIDPPDHKDWEDQENSQTGPQISGKTTFGFNVFLGSDGKGNCIVTKGQIQVVHHRPEQPGQVMWHMSIHNGVSSDDDGHPMPGAHVRHITRRLLRRRRHDLRGRPLPRCRAPRGRASSEPA